LAEALGLRFDLSPALRDYFQRAGHDLPARNGDGRWSLPIPATYVVAQWLHKSASDLFGRALEGLDNTPGASPSGQRSFNAVALAIQQPSPTLAWRFDMTALTDLKGGWLLQPGAKWKPNRKFQLDIYANILKSYGKQENHNFAQGLEYANELFIRGTYAF